MDVQLTVRQFASLYSNVDDAWRAWNATYPHLGLARAAFRAAVRG